MQRIFPMDFQNDKHIAWECEVASRFFSILKYMVFVGEGVECRYIFSHSVALSRNTQKFQLSQIRRRQDIYFKVVALSFGSIINIIHCKHPEKNRHPMMNICVCWIVCELVQKKPMHFLKVIYVLQHQSQSFIFPHCLLNVLM